MGAARLASVNVPLNAPVSWAESFCLTWTTSVLPVQFVIWFWTVSVLPAWVLRRGLATTATLAQPEEPVAVT